MNFLKYRVQVDWDGPVGGNLGSYLLGESRLGEEDENVVFNGNLGQYAIGETKLGESAENITPFVRELSWSRGRDQNSQVRGRSVAGTAEISVDNFDGRFSPFNDASPLAGNILAGRGVTIETSLGLFGGNLGEYGLGETLLGQDLGPTWKPQWTGQLRAPKATAPLLPGLARVTLRAVGNLTKWGAEEELTLPLQKNVLTGVVVNALMDAAGVPSDKRIVEDGNTTLKIFFLDRPSSLLDALDKMDAIEFGFTKETKDGKLEWEDRVHRSSALRSLNVRATYTNVTNDPGSVRYSRANHANPLQEVFNEVTTTVDRFDVDVEQPLWALAAEVIPVIPPDGGTFEIDAKYPGPSAVAQAIAADSWVTPVGNTDFTANSQADQLGTDITADISVAVEKFAKSMRITYTNNNPTETAHLFDVQARGVPLLQLDDIPIVRRDRASIAKFNKRQFPVIVDFMPDIDTARALADFTILASKDPIPLLNVPIEGNANLDNLLHVQDADISDRVQFTGTADSGLFISEEFFIERRTDRVRENGIHTMEVELNPVAARGGAGGTIWVLDQSQYGVDTVLFF